VAAAAFAAGDPGLARVVGEDRSAAGGEQVERVVEQVGQADGAVLGDGVLVPEDHGDVDVAGPQQLQRVLGVAVGQAEFQAGMLLGEDGGRLRDQ
jgi:hypothetical protein